MPQIDFTNPSLYVSNVSTTAANLNGQKEKTEKSKIKKSRFASLVEQHAEETRLVSAGLPKEIAGMEFEDALVYLKDKADIASDLVKTEFSLESFSNYRKAVSNLMKFIVHTNYEVKMNIRRRPSRRFKTEKFYLIDIVDKNILHITVTEGKKNEIRIVLRACNCPVTKLHRISFGPIQLGNLSVGKIRKINQKTIDALLKTL